MPRGYIFHGMKGVGKTSTAYIFARGLMCTGNDPLGCGKCDSCEFIDQNSLEVNPDFIEIDAASLGKNSTIVNEALELLDRVNQPPSQLSRRRVTIIDEAHRLSREAWDVFLKPLESKDTTSIFIFVTNDVDKVPGTIQSRCLSLRYERVHLDYIKGLLARLATENKIEYDLSALQTIARQSKGIVRDAVQSLNTCAMVGKVTAEVVNAVLDNTLEDICLKTYEHIIRNQQVEAVQCIDEAGRNYSPTKVMEVMFSIYARTPWAEPGTIYAAIATKMPNAKEVDDIFLRWSTPTTLPSDSLPLLVYELINTVDVPSNAAKGRSGASRVASAPPRAGVAKPLDLEKFINEVM